MIFKILAIAVIPCMTLVGQFLLKRAATAHLSDLSFVSAIKILQSFDFWTGFIVQSIVFIIWMTVLSRLNFGMSFALVGAGFYIMVFLVGILFLNETYTLQQMLGVALLSVSLVMISTGGANS